MRLAIGVDVLHAAGMSGSVGEHAHHAAMGAQIEIAGGQGAGVLDGRLPVLTVDGEDVSAAFIAGAEQALVLVERHGIRLALLKARSPSCGNRENYDGSFTGTRVAGEGVTAAALRRAGVRVFSEEQLPELEAALRELEG